MTEFDDYKVKINALKPALQGLGEALKLEEAEAEIDKLERESAEEGFWTNLDNSQKVLQKIKQLKNKVSGFRKLASRWDDIMALCQMAMEEQDDSLLPELET